MGRQASKERHSSVLAAFAVAAAATSLGSCSPDRIPGVIGSTPDTSVLILSETLTLPATRAASVQFASQAASYVSLSPGKAPNAVSAVIRNRQNEATVVAFMFDGGFDPVAVPGSSGDTVDVTARDMGGATVLAATATIPIKRRPTIIRTSPPPNKRDVPLNSIITIVFSEPLDPQTLSSASLTLLNGAQPVAGQVRLDSTGIRAEFVPASVLEPSVAYTVSLTGTVSDLTGDSLEPTSFEFTTTENVVTGLSQLALFACFDPPTQLPSPYCGIHVIDADGSNLRSRALTFPVAYDRSPAWSPDGRRIAFSSWRHCTTAGRYVTDCLMELFVMNADGSGIRQLTTLEQTDTLNADYPAWSPDGTRIALVGRRYEPSPKSVLFVMNADGSGRTRLPARSGWYYRDVTWSPAGDRIAFSVGSPDGSSGLHTASPDGTNVERITTGDDYSPAWSPDGTRIAFSRSDSNEAGMFTRAHIYTIDVASKQLVQLTTGASINFMPTWSPNGARIAFVFELSDECTVNCIQKNPGNDNDIHVMNADGSGRRQLAVLPFRTALRNPAWSPFGTVP